MEFHVTAATVAVIVLHRRIPPLFQSFPSFPPRFPFLHPRSLSDDISRAIFVLFLLSLCMGSPMRAHCCNVCASGGERGRRISKPATRLIDIPRVRLSKLHLLPYFLSFARPSLVIHLHFPLHTCPHSLIHSPPTLSPPLSPTI